jgi:outer membrane protein assembly factor BamB
MSHATRYCRWLPVAALTIGTFLSASAFAAGDWPQWHGAKRDNLSTDTGLLKEWPAEGPKLLWKAQKLGKGFSSVSVAEGKIFSMGDAGDGAYVFALNETDGKPLWQTRTGEPGEYGGYHGPRATPSYSDGLLYALNQHGNLVCVDAKTGTLKWQHGLQEELKGSLPGWGYAESPLVVGDLVICTPGGSKGTMAAFDKKSGKLAWRTTDWKDEAHYVSAVPAEIGGKAQVVQMTAQSLAGVDVKTGKLFWRTDRHGSTAVIPTPLVRDDLIFTTSGYDVGCNLFEVTSKGARFDAKQRYANKNMVNHHGGVVLVGDHVYGTDEQMLVCMDLKTGKVAWKNRSVGKGSTAFADGMLYVRSESSGKVALVEATPEAYHEKGTLEQPNRSNDQAWPHPVVTGGRLYLRDQGVLLCYDVKGK